MIAVGTFQQGARSSCLTFSLCHFMDRLASQIGGNEDVIHFSSLAMLGNATRDTGHHQGRISHRGFQPNQNITITSFGRIVQPGTKDESLAEALSQFRSHLMDNGSIFLSEAHQKKVSMPGKFPIRYAL